MKKNILNNSIALLTVGTLTFSPLSCGIVNAAQQMEGAKDSILINTNTYNEDEMMPEYPIAGGWQVNEKALSIKKNKDAAKALKKATKNLAGYTYKPIALLGTQVVAGTNYAILCRDSAVVPDAKPVFEIVYVYQDLDGTAEIIGFKKLVGDQHLDGEYTANTGKISLKKNREINSIFKKAFYGMGGASYQPIAYLGSQIVAGTNYLAIYRTTPVVLDPKPYFTLVTVYEDLNGDVEMGNIETIILGEMDSEEV